MNFITAFAGTVKSFFLINLWSSLTQYFYFSLSFPTHMDYDHGQQKNMQELNPPPSTMDSATPLDT